MNNNVKKLLFLKAGEVANNFSNPDREFNFNKEVFSTHRIVPTSENTAVVFFKKSPSLKLALFFFYYVSMGGGKWFYFCPSDGHILGLQRLSSFYFSVEEKNFGEDKNVN